MKTSELVGMIALLLIWAFALVPAIRNLKLIYTNEFIPRISEGRRNLLLIFYAIGFLGIFLGAAFFIYKIQDALFS
ncbi:hypothetical protein AZI87_04730 [Bdellovibrio bacteriovorus]|uniref:Uncharacterized protein n=1 Tax=Bdellovibrio bacteriovorus TaxID=959 RepID=A0A162GN77_BDEBC|nr:hypothetical protein [Bdellovibrio bacteriovorus]KYG68551.1 hypothetical protein AZI87_04730 [Bdellovibrio bacteriovorus]